MKNKYLFIVFFILCAGFVNAQHENHPVVKMSTKFSSFYNNGDYAAAYPMIEEFVLAVGELNGNSSESYADVLQMSGAICYHLQKNDEAIAYLERAFEVRRTLGKMELARVLVGMKSLASLYQSIGKFKETEAILKEALAIAFNVYGTKNIGYYHQVIQLASFYINTYNFDKAIVLVEETTNFIEKNFKNTDQVYLIIKVSLGLFYMKAGYYEKAYDEVQGLMPKLQKLLKSGNVESNRNTLMMLGYIDYLSGRYKESLHYFNVVLKFYKDNQELYYREFVDLIGMVASNYSALKDYPMAFGYKERYLKLASQLYGKEYVGFKDGLIHLGFLLSLQEEFEKAKSYYIQGMDYLKKDIKEKQTFMTEVEKEKYLLVQDGFFDHFNSYMLRHKNAPDLTGHAYDNVLFVKGQLLNSSIALKRHLSNSTQPETRRLYDTLGSIKKRISNWDKRDAKGRFIEPIKLEAKAQEIEKLLLTKSQFYKDFLKSLNTKFQEVKAHLKQNEIAIELIDFSYYEVANSKKRYYCALLVKPSSRYPELVFLFEEQSLKNLISKNTNNLEAGVNKLYVDNSQSLYNLIWKPIAAKVKEGSTIYYAPTGLLHKISFPALHDGTDYILNKFNLIQMISTAKLLDRQTYKATAIKEVGLVGGIDYGTQQKALPGTKVEVDEIYEVFISQGVTVDNLQGKLAVKDAFVEMVKDKDVLHIATHGYFTAVKHTELNSVNFEQVTLIRGNTAALHKVPNSNLTSGLWFASSRKKEKSVNSILTAEEIGALNLFGTKLVVLSACETGLGKINGSQGVYGLQRAFKKAGVDKIIMSLWKVPDKATQEFMNYFYRSLYTEVSITKAFKKTQLTFSKTHDPYYWAGFVMLD
tara:strand:- start:12981 stop:15584 length:2604 start_codon:yes stop_codon:yes gene_type:complete